MFIGVLANMLKDGQNVGGATAVLTAISDWMSSGSEVTSLLGLLQRVLVWQIGIDSLKPTPNASTTASATAQQQTGTSPTESSQIIPLNSGGSTATTTSQEPHGMLQLSLLLNVNVPALALANETFVQITASIHSLCKSIAKALAGNLRKRDEKLVTPVVQSLAQMLSDHLSWTPSVPTSKELADVERSLYLASIVGELRSLLLDGNLIHNMEANIF